MLQDELDTDADEAPNVEVKEHLVAGLRIEPTVIQRISYAAWQNSVAVLPELRIENESEREFEHLKLTMACQPPLLAERCWVIDRLHPRAFLSLRDREVRLAGPDLARLGERRRAEAYFTLTDVQSRVLAEARREVTGLARNEWGGCGQMPELLAAFVMPNEPAVAELLQAAVGVLEAAGKEPSFNGYQSGRRERAWQVAAALWSAVLARRLVYAEPPASFETVGQKVRTPGEVIHGGLATCLDLTLLFTSALEAAGLHAFVVFTDGHAFPGFWLQPREFPALLEHDAAQLRKLVAMNEVVVFESTLVTRSGGGAAGTPFQQAIRAGEEKIAEREEHHFRFAVDLKRARTQGIRPLDLESDGRTQPQEQERLREPAALEEAPVLGAFDEDVRLDALAEKTPKDRLEKWKTRLLDLTRRNRLLNLKETATALRLFCPNPAALEDDLADTHAFRFLATESSGTSPGDRDSEAYTRDTGRSLDDDLLRSAWERRELVSKLTEKRLHSQLTGLYRKARTDLAEGGSNTLFLALGMLKWRENPEDSRVYRAPLVLLPVTLTRRSAGAPFTLLGHDDATVFNLTLLEMLERDFGIDLPHLRGELPGDDSGVDVPGIRNLVQAAVRDLKGFEVMDEVVLSTFSFAKYLMWQDLDASLEKFRRSPLVRHLLDSPRDAYSNSAEPMRVSEIDEKIDPGDLFLPVPADGSQVVAVHASTQPGDLVLEGPPGTGKSQTIANVIAHNLALGKSVLFVSEKRAALDVVQERLERCGLGSFCLQLHSNKANKKAVLDQLGSAWRAASESADADWDAGSERLRGLQQDLNGLVSDLHRPVASGISARAAVGRAFSSRTTGERVVDLGWGCSLNVDPCQSPEDLAGLRERVRLLAVRAAPIGETQRAALAGVAQTEWSHGWEARTRDRLAEVRDATRGLLNAADAFVEVARLPGTRRDLGTLRSLVAFSSALKNAGRVDLTFALAEDGPRRIALLNELPVRLQAFREKEKSLSAPIHAGGHLHAELDAWNADWRAAGEAFWLLVNGKRKKVRLAMEAALRAEGTLDPASDLPRLLEMRDLDHAMQKMAAAAGSGTPWRGNTTKLDGYVKVVAFGVQVRKAADALAADADERPAVREAVRGLLVDRRDDLTQGSRALEVAARLSAAYSAFKAAYVGLPAELGWPTDVVADPAGLPGVCERLLGGWSGVRDWCFWNEAVAAAKDAGLGAFVAAIASGEVPAEEAAALKAFDVAYAVWLAPLAIDAAPRLRRFHAGEHDRKTAAFRAAGRERAREAVEVIRHRLRRCVPAFDGSERPGGYRVLQRELQKKSRHKPIRQLLDESGDAVRQLTPCVLMSPLSVAQYLPPDREPFDLVVFDEASQISVWDAVGSLARGKKVVVVGDPKQMPPTSFFQKATGEEDEDEAGVPADQESILDEALSAGVRNFRLTGHYRSRHESLIAFSNYRYYESELVTYPSAVTRESAVSHRRVDGLYQGGGNAVNVPEAQAVVAEIVARLSDPLRCEQSLGVVTFSSRQQDQVENLLDDARRAHPELESFFGDEAEEPVFVKNLETVQGDERDVILLSVGYGPSEPGARTMAMRFGPLNNSGGERRLNVAITRSREEMVVFSSFDSSMIDLGRTSAVGIRHLKEFIEYAERGPAALPEALYGEHGPDRFESPFEEAIAAALRALGWEVRTQVGVSRFRIDLGVVHPDFPGRYLVGVECDGASYHRSPSARDRDRVRQDVLEALGWTLRRVWSTDFFTDPDAAVERLHASLKEALQADQIREREKAEETAWAMEEARRIEEVEVASVVEIDRNEVSSAKEPAASGASEATPADLFYGPEHESRLVAEIRRLVDLRGPVRLDVLAKEVAQVHGLRAGRPVRERIRGLIGGSRPSTDRSGEGPVFWPSGRSPVERLPYRPDDVYGARRLWAEIPGAEQVDLLAVVRSTQLTGDSAVEELARRCGYQRLRAKTRTELRQALARAESAGDAESNSYLAFPKED